MVYTAQVNSAFLALWLACSEVIILLIYFRAERNDFFVVVNMLLSFGPLVT